MAWVAFFFQDTMNAEAWMDNSNRHLLLRAQLTYLKMHSDAGKLLVMQQSNATTEIIDLDFTQTLTQVLY